MESADVVIGFPFSTRTQGPGSVHDMLAMSILASPWRHLPLILSGGLARYFSFSPPDVPAPQVAWRIDRESRPRFIALHALVMLKNNGWKTCVVAAHQDRAALCRGVMEQIGIHVAGEITIDSYDDKAREFWMRGPRRFRLWHRFIEIPQYRRNKWIPA